MNTLGERIAYARRKRGLTQVELAEQCGLVQQTIASLEMRKSEHSKYAFGIAVALGVTPEWLVHGSGPEPYWDKPPSQFSVAEEVGDYGSGGPIDWEALETIMGTVEEVLADRSLELEPKKKAKLFRLLYELHLENEDKPIDKSKVIQLVRLAG